MGLSGMMRILGTRGTRPSGGVRFFEGPGVGAVGVAMAMGGEEAAAVLPEPGPDLFAVGLGNLQRGDFFAREKLETPFGMGRWEGFQARLDFKEEHEPVGLPLVTVLADETGEVKVGGGQTGADFFVGFAAGAGIGGFAEVHFEFAAAGAPEAAVGFLGAFEEEDLVLLVEAVEEGGDFVGQRHGGRMN